MPRIMIPHGVRTAIKSTVELAAARLPSLPPSGGRLILAYHGVRKASSPLRGERTLHISAEDMGEQLAVLRSYADVVPLRVLLEANNNRDRLLAITFDDAYASALDNGVPQCISASLPCCIFVSPGLLGLVPRWDELADDGNWTDLQREEFLWKGSAMSRPLSAKHTTKLGALRIATAGEIKEKLSSTGLVTIGNHTLNHMNLGALSDDEVANEIAGADSWLRAFAPECYVPFVAYPFGIPPTAQNPKTLMRNHEFGLLAQGGWIGSSGCPNPYRIPRWNVPAGVSLNGFRARLRGRLVESPRLRR